MSAVIQNKACKPAGENEGKAASVFSYLGCPWETAPRHRVGSSHFKSSDPRNSLIGVPEVLPFSWPQIQLCWQLNLNITGRQSLEHCASQVFEASDWYIEQNKVIGNCISRECSWESEPGHWKSRWIDGWLDGRQAGREGGEGGEGEREDRLIEIRFWGSLYSTSSSKTWRPRNKRSRITLKKKIIS